MQLFSTVFSYADKPNPWSVISIAISNGVWMQLVAAAGSGELSTTAALQGGQWTAAGIGGGKESFVPLIKVSSIGRKYLDPAQANYY